MTDSTQADRLDSHDGALEHVLRLLNERGFGIGRFSGKIGESIPVISHQGVTFHGGPINLEVHGGKVPDSREAMWFLAGKYPPVENPR